MDCSWMKVDVLSSMYVKRVLEFLEYVKQNILGRNGIFYYPCVISRNIKKKLKRNKCFITYVVMEFVKIIQYRCGMVK